MSKVIKDETLIDVFLTRGVAEIYPSKEELKKKLLSGDRIRVYQGFDPSGPYLHVGHAMGIRALRILQELGHEVIFLVGDYTAKVGDPDRETGRPLLSDEQIQRNMQGWKEQAAQLIDFGGGNPVLFKRNYEWLSKLNLAELIKLMSTTTVQQMLERDLFQKRLQKQNPICLQELLYPLMQGFDSVAMGVDMEIGGTDQTFNMLTGRELVRKYLNKEKFVRTNEMMEAPDAITMSKTKGNGINLSDTPENMFGKAMSYQDGMIPKALRLLTDVSIDDIWQIQKDIKKGENPMKFKKMMAFEIVKLLKGEKAARKAQENFEKTVQNKEIDHETAKPVSLSGYMTLREFLKNAMEGKESASQIKRVIEQGGVEVNGNKIVQPDVQIEFKTHDFIKYGKRTVFKVL
jgi:tyrosyl-tRNA synthetase